MNAMILAAGRGERMRPLTDACPKPLLCVGGKPLIVWQLERLRNAGFCNVVINAAYLAPQLHAALGDGTAFGVHIQWSFEPNGLETAGGIRHALPLLGDPFVVVNGDVFCDFDLRCVHAHPASSKHAHLILVDNPEHHPTGDFPLQDAPYTPDAIEKPRLTFAGIGAYRAALFAGLPDHTPCPLGPLLHQAIANGTVSTAHHCGVWHDVGTPARLAELDRLLSP
jgi:N-acetyl-alpha-D-muramate 1-phosphate uridylyltransferase